MSSDCEYISYQSTGYFSQLITDFLKGEEKLSSFFSHPPSFQGIQQAIQDRQAYATDRQLLVSELQKQYDSIELTTLQSSNLASLASDNTFTICTAHQPNIFTGQLYFIYKIIHAIKLAHELTKQLPQYRFVPVYYMGSEDADLEELGMINVSGDKLVWETKQTGAVGRMKVDKSLLKLIDRLAGQLEVLPHGKELIQLLRSAYKEGATIQQSTLILVNELFKEYGLLVLIPDNTNLKKSFRSVVRKEIIEQFSFPIVQQTIQGLSQSYKVQASGRDLNLFYLTDTQRERIEKHGDRYVVNGLDRAWSREEILQELDTNPERFSANVILRPVFQEMILPNVAFIGGGGELAYWLELKGVFETVGVPYPVLVLRNSFLLIEQKQREVSDKISLSPKDFFNSHAKLLRLFTDTRSKHRLDLAEELKSLDHLYNKLAEHAGSVDVSLQQHTEALKKQTLKRVTELEKKMYRKERAKLDIDMKRLNTLKEQWFPKGSLQERVENFSIYYAKYGKDWLRQVRECSLALEQEFGIIQID